MPSEKIIQQQVVQQEIALDSYLSTLLDDIPSDTELDQQELKSEPKPVQLREQTQIAEEIPVIEETEQAFVETEKDEPPTKIKPLAVMPDWAKGEFQALFFKVDKLILATPLTELLRTIKVEETATKIPGQPSWFMGLLDTHDERIGVLDTSQLIFGKTIGQRRNLEENPFQRILITKDGKWGLACDEIVSIGKLDTEKVRWRTLRTKKPWLVGTVIDELTAVVDINQLVPHRKTN